MLKSLSKSSNIFCLFVSLSRVSTYQDCHRAPIFQKTFSIPFHSEPPGLIMAKTNRLGCSDSPGVSLFLSFSPSHPPSSFAYNTLHLLTYCGNLSWVCTRRGTSRHWSLPCSWYFCLSCLSTQGVAMVLVEGEESAFLPSMSFIFSFTYTSLA